MRIFILLIIACGIYFGCQKSQTENDVSFEEIPHHIVHIDSLKPLVAKESGTLAGPIILTELNNKKFAVLDVGLNEVLIFDNNGEKQLSFGSTGEGPGEWAKSGPVNLHYFKDKFLVSDSNRYKIFLYEKNGTLIDEINMPVELRYSNKLLISSDKVLVASSGYKNSLALILDINNDGKIVGQIGNTQNKVIQNRNLEVVRESLSNREVPEVLKNEALIAKNSNGIGLLLNSIGEIQYFDNNGILKWKVKLPKEITVPVLNYVAQKNTEAAGSNTYFSLNYAVKFKADDNGIYLLTNKFQDDKNIKQYLLVYSLTGDLKKILKFEDKENQSYFSDFFFNHEKIILSNLGNSEILFIVNDLVPG